MTDPVSTGARAAAERLAPDHDPGLAADVEAALYTRGQEQRPDQFFDPVSLGALIVSIASLTWTVYTDLKKKTHRPAPEVVARTVRVELGKQDGTGPPRRRSPTSLSPRSSRPQMRQADRADPSAMLHGA
jgi:hypothetical protein